MLVPTMLPPGDVPDLMRSLAPQDHDSEPTAPTTARRSLPHRWLTRLCTAIGQFGQLGPFSRPIPHHQETR